MNGPAHAFSDEVFGAFLMCFFGIGAVTTAVMTGAHTGPFQVDVAWGITIVRGRRLNVLCPHDAR